MANVSLLHQIVPSTSTGISGERYFASPRKPEALSLMDLLIRCRIVLLRPSLQTSSKTLFTFLLTGAVFAACQSPEGTTPTSTTTGTVAVDERLELRLVPGAPLAVKEEPQNNSYDLEGYVTTMAGRGSLVTTGTTTGVYELGSSGPKLLPIVGVEPDLPAETGIVRAMAGYDDGILIIADNDILFARNGALTRSAGKTTLEMLGVKTMNARFADDDGDMMTETHVSLVGANGGHELSAGNLITWGIEGEMGAPSAILAQKDTVFLVYGRQLYEVDKAKGEAFVPPFDMGNIHEIACSSLACDPGSLVYFASDRGLVERSASGVYSLYTLTDTEGQFVGVESFAIDGSKQRLYAIAANQLLRIRSGDVPTAVATLPAAKEKRKLVVDKIGDVWVGGDQQVTKYALGTPLSFLTDVQPIMHEYCAECHAAALQGAPKIDFEDYSVAVGLVERIIARAAVERSMPPGTYDKKLPAELITILKEWAVTKAP